jgi:hypothetical protein
MIGKMNLALPSMIEPLPSGRDVARKAAADQGAWLTHPFDRRGQHH